MDGDCGEVRSQKTEVSNQKSEGKSQRSEGGVSDFRLLTSIAIILFFVVFYFYPMAAIIGRGVSPAMLDTLADADTWRIVGFTCWQAALSTLLTLAVGLPGAYLVARYTFRGQSLLRALTAVPFVMPTLVVAAGFNALIGKRGWINLLLASLRLPTPALTHSLAAILLAHIFYNTTIVIRLVGDYWSHLDPRLAQAARTLGANRLRAFAAVTLPLLSPALLAAALLVFIFDFTSFGVVLVLGGPRFATLEVEIYRQTFAFFDLPAAAALSLLQLACTFALTLIYTRLSARLSAPANLRSTEFTQKPLHTLRRKLAAAIIVAGLFALLLSPLAALGARSVTRLEAERGQRGEIQRGLTLDYYRALFDNERGEAFFVSPIAALGNSIRYALITVMLSLLLGIPTAWALATPSPVGAVSTAEGRGGGLLESLILLPLGTSAITLGLGFLLAFNRAPLNLRASPLLIPLAHTLIAFPFVVRTLLPTWRSIRPQWRRAAATLGASPAKVWRRIDLPIIGRAAIVAAAFAFAISLGEFGATALLTRPELPTAAVAIYSFIGKPGALNFGRALAMSVLLMIATASSILLIEKLRIKGVAEF
ncbi:MAG: iron ABC transporter permease [Chloroflexi bacterium]|nr:iron ABC transporter permease [Chloroflexota bacterium]